jgi:hypothetical protein
MVRPASFGWNPETAPSNRFQGAAPAGRDRQGEALREFDSLAAALAGAGVDVHVLEDSAEPRRPDAVFPNNWVSLHADGTIVLYPMLAPNRRLERRPELLARLAARGGFRVARVVDLTHHERAGCFLEGTGSVVFDHIGRRAYAALSPRSDASVLRELCAELGYEPVPFAATGPGGAPVYHTNVMLSIGRRFVLVCAEAIDEAERGPLLERLADGGRQVETISAAHMAMFAGNLLELDDASGAGVLAVSQRGWNCLDPGLRLRLGASVGRVVAAPVPAIEDAGGGSVRCMLAEVFLPRS